MLLRSTLLPLLIILVSRSFQLKSRDATVADTVHHHFKSDIEVGSSSGVHLGGGGGGRGGYYDGGGGLGGDYEDLLQTTIGMRGVGAFELDGEDGGGAVELPPIWEDEFGEEQTAAGQCKHVCYHVIVAVTHHPIYITLMFCLPYFRSLSLSLSL